MPARTAAELRPSQTATRAAIAAAVTCLGVLITKPRICPPERT